MHYLVQSERPTDHGLSVLQVAAPA